MDSEELNDLRRIAKDTTVPMSTRQQAQAKYEAAINEAAQHWLQKFLDK